MKQVIGLLLSLAALPVLGEPICVTDSLARKVCLDTPAQRIITLAPHLAENVFSAGAGEKLVGVTSYSDYPEAARQISRIGSFNAFSLEQITALAPDLVLIWGSGNGERALRQLTGLGYTVYVDELQRVNDIPESILDIGKLAGTEAIARSATASFTQQVETARQTRTNKSLTVFYQIWNQPLQTVGGAHIISEVIDICGGRNLFADSTQLAPQVSLESVLVRNPDVIIGSTMDSSEPVWLEDWLAYPNLSAVKHEAIFAVDPDTLQRPTLRLAEGIGDVCALLGSARYQ